MVSGRKLILRQVIREALRLTTRILVVRRSLEPQVTQWMNINTSTPRSTASTSWLSCLVSANHIYGGARMIRPDVLTPKGQTLGTAPYWPRSWLLQVPAGRSGWTFRLFVAGLGCRLRRHRVLSWVRIEEEEGKERGEEN